MRRFIDTPSPIDIRKVLERPSHLKIMPDMKDPPHSAREVWRSIAWMACCTFQHTPAGTQRSTSLCWVAASAACTNIHVLGRSTTSYWPEFAVYRHLRTRNPCMYGAYLPKRLETHRYMNRRVGLDITPMALSMRRHVPTNNPTATQARSRRHLLAARRKLLPQRQAALGDACHLYLRPCRPGRP